MSDDSVALTTITPAPAPSEQDYEAILGAVEETARGRWFLTEYARRNRNSDTRIVLDAIERVEAVLRGDAVPQPYDRVRFDLIEMAKAIARTRAEIAAIKPDAEHDGKIGAASVELDAIVRATERATSDVLAAAEQIQEAAWTMREADIDPAICDRLDARATDIYTACSFQDLTGQRIHKVIDVLHYLEQRINAMIAIWGDAVDDGAMTVTVAEHAAEPESAALDQADVDLVLHVGPEAPAPGAETMDGATVTPGATHSSTPQDDGPAAPEDEPSHRDGGGDGAVRIFHGLEQEDAPPPYVFVYRSGGDAADRDPPPAAPEQEPDRAIADTQQLAAPGVLETLAVEAFRTELGSAQAEPPSVDDAAVTDVSQAAAQSAAPQPASDPLADVRALSDAEKIALCR
jgi:chemotaxis regulatin CheY-phosphate phosphatase CheZ